MSVIKVENLSFSYNSKNVLNNINFDIEKGDFLSILGPNGSGKSTLLKLINNTLKKEDSNIKIKNKNLKDYTPKELAKEVTLVPQYFFVEYNFTVWEIVMMGRYPHKSRFESENKFDVEMVERALKLTNTYHLKDRKITMISGGERQRVIIAKSIVQDSEIMLLDEPTSNLDINHQLEIMKLLKYLNEKEGKTIVLVIHDINSAIRFSKNIILLHKGKILSSGDPLEVISKENMNKAYGIDVEIKYNENIKAYNLIPIDTV